MDEKSKGFLSQVGQQAKEKAQQALGSEAAQRAKELAGQAKEKAQQALDSETAQKAKELAGQAARQAQQAVAEAAQETSQQAQQVYAQAKAGEGIAAVKSARLSKKTVITIGVVAVVIIVILGVIGKMSGGSSGSGMPTTRQGFVDGFNKAAEGVGELRHLQDHIYQLYDVSTGNAVPQDILVQVITDDGGKLSRVTSTASGTSKNASIAYYILKMVYSQKSNEEFGEIYWEVCNNSPIELDGIQYMYTDTEMYITIK